MLFRFAPASLARVAEISDAPSPFDTLGEIVFRRTYARPTGPDGARETWTDVCIRVVEGTYSIQKEHITSLTLGWDEGRAQASALEMFERMFTMKFMPPGRGLWAMGTPLIHEKKLGAALNNCAFVSTINIDKDPVAPFVFLMEASMLGVGVGFDTLGATHRLPINAADPHHRVFVIPDTREGWVESVGQLIGARVGASPSVTFDYSAIRPRGELLKTFGGVSSGPGPLIELHESLTRLFENAEPAAEHVLGARNIVDMMNLIGKCVVAGNIRRSAEICFGDPTDEFLDLKNYEKNPDRAAWGWASNNTVFATFGMDYTSVCERIVRNGEPGLAWLSNMRDYGRMCDAPDGADRRVSGGNPCLTADTFISTFIDGECCVRRIDELVGKQFTSRDGNGMMQQSDERGFWFTGRKTVFRVTTGDNMCSIKGTANHLLLVVPRGETDRDRRFDRRGHPDSWIAIRDIRPGMVMWRGAPSDMSSDDMRVTKIELLEEEDVYDCRFPTTHCFSAGGFVAHNCLEQSLESFEMCTLVETFPSRHETCEDFLRTLKFAYLYAKTVTLCRTHWELTNQVMLRNRRIGCSVSGIAQFLEKQSLDELRVWLTTGYDTLRRWDDIYSEWFCVPRSIKITSVKPSGTVSILAGSTPGMHFPVETCFVRRVRFSDTDPLLGPIRDAGYPVLDVPSEPNTVVVEIPVQVKGCTRTARDVPMYEQLSLCAFLQRYWADNQVSCTVSFNPVTEGPHLARAIELFQYQLKGVSFFPRREIVGYEFLPNEAITITEHFTRSRATRSIEWGAGGTTQQPLEEFPNIGTMPEGILYCDGACPLGDGVTPSRTLAAERTVVADVRRGFTTFPVQK